jgi:hypothetical protein
MSENRNRVNQTSNYNFDWNNSNVLQYVFDVNKHNFDVMLGQNTVPYAVRFCSSSAP